MRLGAFFGSDAVKLIRRVHQALPRIERIHLIPCRDPHRSAQHVDHLVKGVDFPQEIVILSEDPIQRIMERLDIGATGDENVGIRLG